MLRISAARWRHVMTNLEVSSLRHFGGATEFCPFLKIVKSSAMGALRQRRR